jgi:DNA-binding winged helix-turn-helix (wHTH) protein
MPLPPSGTLWQFDRFTVLPEQRLLLHEGTPVPLTSKSLDTLLVLIENRDRVVTKDELLRSVWPDVEVEEGNLTQQVFLLRKALGETAQQPRYIATVPGHGYRFMAPLQTTSADQGYPSREVQSGASRWTVRYRKSTRSAVGLIALGIVGLLAIVSGWRWLTRDKTGTRLDWTNARPTKVTESGSVTSAAISLDGRYLAYVENDGDEYSLWVQPAIPRARRRSFDASRSC